MGREDAEPISDIQARNMKTLLQSGLVICQPVR